MSTIIDLFDETVGFVVDHIVDCPLFIASAMAADTLHDIVSAATKCRR